ncbi:MAG: LysM peptidoglycan-binding domain-containing protein [Gammaproteobacteria bacterium]
MSDQLTGVARTICRQWVSALLMAVSLTGAASAADALLRPAGLEPDIAFWRQIFAEVSTNEALTHDNRHLNIVYATVDLSDAATDTARQRRLDAAKDHYIKILKRLASGDCKNLGKDERRVLALWADRPGNATLRAAADRVRIQQGLSDRYREGLIRSGRWETHIRQSLRLQGVPEQLAALPHVESSFNPEARSYAGAAGLWQFTVGTGRRFMRIDSAVDERRDPYRSSEAAARLLKANYGELDSWPLAITAYNHGTGGMRRAMRDLGTNNIETIMRNYDGPSFGFASRNFYVSFLAAEEVERTAEKYFGPVQREEPEHLTVIAVPAYLSIKTLEQAFGISREALQAYNPALLPPIWTGKKYVPRGLVLHLPDSLSGAEAGARLADISTTQMRTAQIQDPAPRTHRVRRGDTVSGIAARYGTSSATVARLNGLSRKNLIRVGQVLKLPGSAAPSAGPANSSSRSTYVVRRGDSLSVIAKRTGVPQRQLMALNDLDNANRLYPGQRLRLTKSGEGS